MKRQYLLVALFFLIVGFSDISWAGGFLPLEGSIGVGARLYGVFPKGDAFHPGQSRQKLDFEENVGAEVNFTYRFLKYLALEGGIGYTQIDVRNKALGVNWAMIKALPISTTIQFRRVSSDPEQLKWIVPYASIGGGYYLLAIEEKSELVNYYLSNGIGIALKIDNAFAFHLGGGLDIFLTDHVALNIDARYSWGKADIDERLTVGYISRELGDTINLNAAFICAGFKFYF